MALAAASAGVTGGGDGGHWKSSLKQRNGGGAAPPPKAICCPGGLPVAAEAESGDSGTAVVAAAATTLLPNAPAGAHEVRRKMSLDVVPLSVGTGAAIGAEAVGGAVVAVAAGFVEEGGGGGGGRPSLGASDAKELEVHAGAVLAGAAPAHPSDSWRVDGPHRRALALHMPCSPLAGCCSGLNQELLRASCALVRLPGFRSTRRPHRRLAASEKRKQLWPPCLLSLKSKVPETNALWSRWPCSSRKGCRPPNIT
mmetsp:Transcript_92375/g.197971  ORF Transcript_92375/g.197971 Transcript_92375/m.197971 type:complete len:254 (+) Transcript_92375:705-1466(+)